MFDVVRLEGADLTSWPYARRRAALETLFADTPLTAPFTLCPSTTDPATARDWLTWTSAGLEGLCFKRLSEPYRAGVTAWGKYKVRVTTEANRRRRHRNCGRASHAAARRHGPPALHRPHRPHRDGRPRGNAGPGQRRAPVDGAHVHRRVGQPRRP
ncbi:hypothetical protein [Streptomyces sp. NPDC057381]|uniref:ATP-dependent DNA ligase n=1 Tax=Streptomyces sp. NPDC057381 TaxID=3346111 RepID=UPI003630F31A